MRAPRWRSRRSPLRRVRVKSGSAEEPEAARFRARRGAAPRRGRRRRLRGDPAIPSRRARRRSLKRSWTGPREEDVDSRVAEASADQASAILDQDQGLLVEAAEELSSRMLEVAGDDETLIREVEARVPYVQ